MALRNYIGPAGRLLRSVSFPTDPDPDWIGDPGAVGEPPDARCLRLPVARAASGAPLTRVALCFAATNGTAWATATSCLITIQPFFVLSADELGVSEEHGGIAHALGEKVTDYIPVEPLIYNALPGVKFGIQVYAAGGNVSALQIALIEIT